MTEQQLNIGAILLEFGSPAAILAVWLHSLQLRSRLVVVLGAAAPLLCSYAYVVVRHAFVSRTDVDWGFYAMWLMTFWPYLACLVLGMGLSLLRQPVHLAMRFVVGLAAPVGVWFLIQGGL